MSYDATFDDDLDGYAAGGGYESAVSWNGSIGNPAAGCVEINAPAATYNGPGITKSDSFGSFPNKVWFSYRITGKTGASAGNAVSFNVTAYFGSPSLYLELVIPYEDWATTDTGWIQTYLDIPTPAPGATITSLYLNFVNCHVTSEALIAYIDNVSISTSAPPFEAGATFGYSHSAGGIPGAVLVA